MFYGELKPNDKPIEVLDLSPIGFLVGPYSLTDRVKYLVFLYGIVWDCNLLISFLNLKDLSMVMIPM
jgi:hypothetical protein